MRQKVRRYVSIDKTELKTEEYVIYHEFGNATDIEFPKDDSFCTPIIRKWKWHTSY